MHLLVCAMEFAARRNENHPSRGRRYHRLQPGRYESSRARCARTDHAGRYACPRGRPLDTRRNDFNPGLEAAGRADGAAWLPDSTIADAFGPYIPIGGFALRGPTAGFHLAAATSAKLTWVGRGPKGERAELTLTIMPSADPAQMRRRLPPDEPPDLGRIGPDALGATRVDTMQKNTDTLPVRQIDYDIYDRGRHAQIQISVTSNDKADSLETLTACAMTLRRARPGEKSWRLPGIHCRPDTIPPPAPMIGRSPGRRRRRRFSRSSTDLPIRFVRQWNYASLVPAYGVDTMPASPRSIPTRVCRSC